MLPIHENYDMIHKGEFIMSISKLTIELPNDTLEKLSLLKHSYKKRKGIAVSDTTLIQTLITREFIQEITPFDLNDYLGEKEQH